jgi:hypothetical protein
MSKFDYAEESKNLSEVIEVAIDSIKKYPPKEFSEEHISRFIETYLDFKNKVINPESKYRNAQSLKILKNDVLIFFQEGKGAAVNFFWSIIRERNLGYKRENKLLKILKKQKISNKIEYDFVIDVLLPYQQEGLIDAQEVVELNKMIAKYEVGAKST